MGRRVFYVDFKLAGPEESFDMEEALKRTYLILWSMSDDGREPLVVTASSAQVCQDAGVVRLFYSLRVHPHYTAYEPLVEDEEGCLALGDDSEETGGRMAGAEPCIVAHAIVKPDSRVLLRSYGAVQPMYFAGVEWTTSAEHGALALAREGGKMDLSGYDNAWAGYRHLPFKLW